MSLWILEKLLYFTDWLFFRGFEGWQADSLAVRHVRLQKQIDRIARTAQQQASIRSNYTLNEALQALCPRRAGA